MSKQRITFWARMGGYTIIISMIGYIYSGLSHRVDAVESANKSNYEYHMAINKDISEMSTDMKYMRKSQEQILEKMNKIDEIGVILSKHIIMDYGKKIDLSPSVRVNEGEFENKKER